MPEDVVTEVSSAWKAFGSLGMMRALPVQASVKNTWERALNSIMLTSSLLPETIRIYKSMRHWDVRV